MECSKRFWVFLFLVFLFLLAAYFAETQYDSAERSEPVEVMYPEFEVYWNKELYDISITKLIHAGNEIDFSADLETSRFTHEGDPYTSTIVNFTDPLNFGTHNLIMNATEERVTGNQTIEERSWILNFTFDIRVDSVNVTLIEPEPLVDYNIAYTSNDETDLVINTNLESECRYSATKKDFDELDYIPSQHFNTDDGYTHYLYDFNRHSESGENLFETYIVCKDYVERQSDFFDFEIHYDSSSPDITDFDFFPQLLTRHSDPFNVSFQTDDLSICKLDFETDNFDDMDVSLSDDYSTSFSNQIYLPEQYTENSDYSFNIVCKNPAGLETLKKESIRFDESIGEEITLLEPSGSINIVRPNLRVETSRESSCEYYFDDSWNEFEIGAYDRVHRAVLSRGLNDGSYEIDVRCEFSASGRLVTDILNFSVDTTPPQIVSLSVTPEDCEKEITVDLNFNDLTDIDESEFFIGTSEYPTDGYDSVDHTSKEGDSFTYRNSDFENNGSYYINLRANDGLNEWSEYHSQQFEFNINPNACFDDPIEPEVVHRFFKEEQDLFLELNCSANSVGCNMASFEYGFFETKEDCNYNKTYQNPILINESGYVCYYVENNNGISIEDIISIDYESVKSEFGLSEGRHNINNLTHLVNYTDKNYISRENDVIHEYEDKSWSNLKLAYNEAKNVIDNESRTIEMVDDSYYTLNESLNSLVLLNDFYFEIYVYEKVNEEFYDKYEFPIENSEIVIDDNSTGFTDSDGFFNISFRYPESENITKDLEIIFPGFNDYSSEILLEPNKNNTKEVFLSEIEEVDNESSIPDDTEVDVEFNLILFLLRLFSFIFFISSLVLFYVHHKRLFDKVFKNLLHEFTSLFSRFSKNDDSNNEDKPKSFQYIKKKHNKSNIKNKSINETNKKPKKQLNVNRNNKNKLIQAMILKELRRNRKNLNRDKRKKMLESFDKGDKIPNKSDLENLGVSKLKK
ncbi:MAG: hypothetical protein ACOCQD_04220, partial [archaeon]